MKPPISTETAVSVMIAIWKILMDDDADRSLYTKFRKRVIYQIDRRDDIRIAETERKASRKKQKSFFQRAQLFKKLCV